MFKIFYFLANDIPQIIEKTEITNLVFTTSTQFLNSTSQIVEGVVNATSNYSTNKYITNNNNTFKLIVNQSIAENDYKTYLILIIIFIGN